MSNPSGQGDTAFGKPAPYYFYYGKIGIISDVSGADEAIKEFPELPVKTLKEWEELSKKKI